MKTTTIPERERLLNLKKNDAMAFHKELEEFAGGEYWLDKDTAYGIEERFLDNAEKQDMKTNALLANEKFVFDPDFEDLAGLIGVVLIVAAIVGLTAIFGELR